MANVPSLVRLHAVSLRNVCAPSFQAGVPALYFCLISSDGTVIFRSETTHWTANPSWRLSWQDVCEDKRALEAIARYKQVRFQLFCASATASAGWGSTWSAGVRSEDDAEPRRPVGTLYPPGPAALAGDTQVMESLLDFRSLVFLPFNVFAALAVVGRTAQGQGRGRGEGREGRERGDRDGRGVESEAQDVDLAAADAAGYVLDSLPLNFLILSLEDGEYLAPDAHSIVCIRKGQAEEQQADRLAAMAASSASLASPSPSSGAAALQSPRPGTTAPSISAPSLIGSGTGYGQGQGLALAKHDLRRAFDAINRLMQVKRETDAAEAAIASAVNATGAEFTKYETRSGKGALAAVALARASEIAATYAEAERLEQECSSIETCLQQRENTLRSRLQAVAQAGVQITETAALLPEVAAHLAAAQSGALAVRGMLAGKQLVLLSEVRGLYPIAEQDKGRRWSIRGIVLPGDRDLGTAPDEAVSTALGYTSHAVALAAKYLSVPLRYAPHPMSSSSSMRDEVITNTREFPLYVKGGDRESQRVGARMLQRDVKQLLCSQGLSYVDGLHILANLNRLFVVLLDAPLPDAA